MFPGMNSKQMQQAMKRFGIKQTEIEAEEVIIKCKDKEIIIKNPSVSKVDMMGQNTFQISGEEHERTLNREIEISEEDVKTVMEQASCSKESALKAIRECEGDLAEAIIKLKK